MASRPHQVAAAAPDDLSGELRDLRGQLERLWSELADLRAHAASMESLAHEDPLTGLLNRRGFMRELARAIAYRARYDTPIALVLADLDSFKPINDALGHKVGDLALAHFASILAGNVRASDSIGRIGGDEFAVILWQLDETAAAQKARALQAIADQTPLAAEGMAVDVGASFGVTMLQPGDTPEDATARADRAMYLDKVARRAPRR